jgi:hypothetical protein
MAGNVVKGQWTNADGLPVKFPQVFTDPAQRTNKATGAEEILGVVSQIIVPYDLSKLAAGTTSFTQDLDNDGTTDGFSEHDVHLPAYTTVRNATVIPTVTAVGGTSMTVGTFKRVGTTISANSLVTATEGVTANLVLGNKVIGAGALVTNTGAVAGVGASNAWIGITVAGTFTAGAGFIVLDVVTVIPETSAADA